MARSAVKNITLAAVYEEFLKPVGKKTVLDRLAGEEQRNNEKSEVPRDSSR